MHVTDLNESLRRIQQQRFLWQRFVAEGITPQVPVGIADVQVAHQQVMQDLTPSTSRSAGPTSEAQLANLPIHELLELLARARRRIGCAAQPAGAHRAAQHAA